MENSAINLEESSDIYWIKFLVISLENYLNLNRSLLCKSTWNVRKQKLKFFCLFKQILIIKWFYTVVLNFQLKISYTYHVCVIEVLTDIRRKCFFIHLLYQSYFIQNTFPYWFFFYIWKYFISFKFLIGLFRFDWICLSTKFTKNINFVSLYYLIKINFTNIIFFYLRHL